MIQSHLEWLNILDHFNYMPAHAWKKSKAQTCISPASKCPELCKHACKQYIQHMQIEINLICKNMKGHEFSRITFELVVVLVFFCITIKFALTQNHLELA